MAFQVVKVCIVVFKQNLADFLIETADIKLDDRIPSR